MSRKKKNAQLNYEELFRKYYKDMLAVALKYLHDIHDAEDAVSRAFISLMDNPELLEGLAEEDIKPRLMSLARYSFILEILET